MHLFVNSLSNVLLMIKPEAKITHLPPENVRVFVSVTILIICTALQLSVVVHGLYCIVVVYD